MVLLDAIMIKRSEAMTYLMAGQARKSLYQLIDQVSIDHEPTTIKGKRNTAVLISLEDWEDIQETLFVASSKELSDTIIRGLSTDFKDCSSRLEE